MKPKYVMALAAAVGIAVPVVATREGGAREERNETRRMVTKRDPRPQMRGTTDRREDGGMPDDEHALGTASSEAPDERESHAGVPHEDFQGPLTGEGKMAPGNREPLEEVAPGTSLPAVRLSSGFRLPAVLMPMVPEGEGGKKPTPEIEKAVVGATNRFYREIAEDVAARDPDAVTTVNDPEGPTVVIAPDEVTEEIVENSDEQFRSLFGDEAYGRKLIQSQMEARLPPDGQ